MKKRGMLLVLAALLCVLAGVSRLESGRKDLGRERLEEALRRTAVSCYACEGAYPPDVAYMQEHYGLQYDSVAYTVRYELFASNLMPDITVLENVP